MELFKLVGSILVDNSKANESISKTSEKTDGLANKFLSGVKTAGKFAAGVGAAAVATGAAIFKMAEGASENLDAIAKGSQKVGLSTQSYQELDYVLRHNGTSIEACSKSFKTFGQNMDSIITSGNEAGSAYGKLGIALKDSEGNARSHNEVMYDSIKALADMEDTTQRNQLAQEMFGSKYTELIPLLNSGSASFEELTQKANDLGLVMGEDSIKAGEAMQDNLQDIKDSMSALTTKIGAQLLPIVNEVLQWILAHMPEIQAFVQTAFDYMGKAIQFLTPIVKQVFEYISIAMNQFVLPAINKGIEIFGKIMSKAQEMKNKFDTVIGGIKSAFNGLSFKMPSIKLPHFGVTPKGWQIGDLLKGKIPKLKVDWYAEAMDEPMVFSKPTILPTQNGLKGVGEAGTEYVSGKTGIVDAVKEAMKDMNFSVYLDGNILVGYINKKMSTTAKLELRGVR